MKEVENFEENNSKDIDEKSSKKTNEDANNNILNEAPKAVNNKRKSARTKVKISSDTEDYLQALIARANMIRGAIDSSQYDMFFAGLIQVQSITQSILDSRKSGKIFDEEAAYRSYVKAVNNLKAYAKAYETYKLSDHTENPEGEAGKKKLNSKDKHKLELVRQVMNNRKFFGVTVPTVKKTPDFLKKTDEALERLKTGNYENDPDNKKFLRDAAYAINGQIVRATGGAVLKDRNTGKRISFDALMKRSYQDGLLHILRSKNDKSKYVSPQVAYRMANEFDYLRRLGESSMVPDEGFNPDKPPRTAGQTEKYMKQNFAREMEKFMLDIAGTYGKGKSDSSPSKLMKSVLTAIRNMSAPDDKKAAKDADTRISDMTKLSMDQFEERIDALRKTNNGYLDKRKNPTKGDRVDRNEYLERLKRKLTEYKKEIESIKKGKGGFVHEPKIEITTKGENISYEDLKKNLVYFAMIMAEKADEGRSVLFRYDPESFNPDAFGNIDPPEEPVPEVRKVFDAMKEFRALFRLQDGTAPAISFDLIKEKVTAFNKALILCKSNAPNLPAEYKAAIYPFIDNCTGMFKLIEAMEPYVNMDTIEGKLGSKNIYDVVKTLPRPICNMKLFASEHYFGGASEFKTAAEARAAVKAYNDTKELKSKDGKKYFINALSKEIGFRDSILIDYINSSYETNTFRPLDSVMTERNIRNRKEDMMRIVAAELFIREADDKNLWADLKKFDDNNKEHSLRICMFDHFTKDFLENNPAFLNVLDRSVNSNITENFLAEAKKLGTYDEFKQKLSVEGMKEYTRSKNVVVNKAPVNQMHK